MWTEPVWAEHCGEAELGGSWSSTHPGSACRILSITFPTLEEQADDLRAVMDDAGTSAQRCSRRRSRPVASSSSPTQAPERVDALLLWSPSRIVQDDARGGLDRLRRQIRGDRGRVGYVLDTGARAAASASSHRAFRTSACVVVADARTSEREPRHGPRHHRSGDLRGSHGDPAARRGPDRRRLSTPTPCCLRARHATWPSSFPTPSSVSFLPPARRLDSATVESAIDEFVRLLTVVDMPR